MKIFDEILAIPEGPNRTVAVVSWLQGLYPVDEDKPILVGGAAVELYTGGAYTTGDLDFVGSVPSSVASALSSAGFERRGRHWIHEEGEIFIEFPSSALDSGEESVFLDMGSERVLIVDPEALVADRLAAWHAWKSSQDGVNAWLIAKGRDLDLQRISTLARVKGVSVAADLLSEALELWQDRDPTEEELISWAETFPDE